MNDEKGRCSVCLAEFRLKKDGTPRWHGNGVRVGPYAHQMCPGVGKPPAVSDAE